jgi:Na/Pi-cotransporter
VEFIDAVSDAGGRVRVRLTTGRVIGDQYVRIFAAGHPEVNCTIRVINGIRVTGEKQEVVSGGTAKNPLEVTIYGLDGRPAAGIPVHFTVVSAPGSSSKASCSPKQALTNADGIASSRVTVDKSTGVYRALIEVAAPGYPMRGIEVPVYGRNLWGLTGLAVTVLGGLAIFIFGMKSMSDGLQLVAGEKMRQILHFVTRNRVAAVAAGALVTGVIQSSSACTVMTVGFVNAGLLTLQQSIGIIFGANIGTTVTAQILSFNAAALALPAITVGLLVLLLSKRVVPQGWGQTLLGAGLLFFGMEMMSVELKQVAALPSVMQFFQSFDCAPLAAGGPMPFGAVLGAIGIGTLMTVIIQSSSATIGIALALASSGLLNFYTAVPLILGDNIGTTITANLAAIGANRPAKQTAIAHFLFNIIGTLVILGLFFVPWGKDNTPIFLAFIDHITPGNVLCSIPENITRHIAMAHTMFNVCNVILLMPFIPRIAAVCRWILPEAKQEVPINHLEPHLLNTPSIALEQVIASIRQMTAESWDMIREATDGMFLPDRYDPEAARVLAEREEAIDRQQDQVTDYLVQVSTRRLTEPQAEIIPLLMHCVNDAERIADHAENIVALAERMAKNRNKLSEDAREELVELWRCLNEQAEHVLSGLRRTDQEDVILALLDEKRINKLSAKLEKSHVARMKKGRCKVTAGIIFLEMVGELEKIGDHFTNIADRTPEIQQHHLAIRD